MKHLFIVNPAAGKGKPLKLVPEIKKILDVRKQEYAVEYTSRPGQVKEIASRYKEYGTYKVYSVGGDGTLNEVLNSFMGYADSFAVIPAGSGNDFFRSIAGDNTDKIVERTIDGTERPIDIGRVNGKYFINIGSMGFDAHVAHNANTLKERNLLPSGWVYVASILLTLLKNKGYRVDMTFDDKTISDNILLSVIANGKYYGGGMLPVPGAVMDDGMFDICVIQSLSMLKILLLFPRYMKGRHVNMKEVSFYKGKKVGIRCNRPIPLNVDGEVEYVENPEFEILPKAINIIVPASVL